jgi:hypothetical protein
MRVNSIDAVPSQLGDLPLDLDLTCRLKSGNIKLIKKVNIVRREGE